ncbi:MAG: hypothetical protein COY40_03415 [Alphaproteobacteria bacterium CG_4_10_14_0_8_um_filter_53_9]|nr:MAG: hypothetical protein COY40_03415 [Alphaproteobacteria bacterium CG_4_10_14_0_8_um_filter_53_9]
MFDVFGLSKQKEEAKPAVKTPVKRTKKAPPPKVTTRKKHGAYKTITEAAAELKVAAHVLRFWESKFSQLQPLKQSGGRRFYRPEDIALLRHIQDLLYNQGYSVRGVQVYLDNAKKSELKDAVQQNLMSVNEMMGELKAIKNTLMGEKVAPSDEERA